MIRRTPLGKLPKTLRSNEFYAVVSRVFVKGAAKDSGVENVQNLWQFKPSNKIRKMPLDTIEDVKRYEEAFIDQLERNNRVEEFKELMKSLEEQYDVVHLICSCDETYINDYCHTETLLKLVKPSLEDKKQAMLDNAFAHLNETPLEFPELDDNEYNAIKDVIEYRRAYKASWIKNKRRGV